MLLTEFVERRSGSVPAWRASLTRAGRIVPSWWADGEDPLQNSCVLAGALIVYAIAVEDSVAPEEVGDEHLATWFTGGAGTEELRERLEGQLRRAGHDLDAEVAEALIYHPWVAVPADADPVAVCWAIMGHVNTLALAAAESDSTMHPGPHFCDGFSQVRRHLGLPQPWATAGSLPY